MIEVFYVHNPIMSGEIELCIDLTAIPYMGHGAYNLVLYMVNTE